MCGKTFPNVLVSTPCERECITQRTVELAFRQIAQRAEYDPSENMCVSAFGSSFSVSSFSKNFHFRVSLVLTNKLN